MKTLRFFSLMLSLVFIIPFLTAQEQDVNSLLDKSAPDWELKQPNGSLVKLSALKGSVVVLDFWATWCPPCRMSMPGIDRLNNTWKLKNVKVLGVNAWEKDPSKAVEYMKTQGFTYGLVLNGDEVAARYGITGIPTLIVIDPKGIIREIHIGYDENLEQNLGRVIKKLLK